MFKNGLIAVVLCGIMMGFSSPVNAVTQDEESKITAAMPDKPIAAPARQRAILVFSRCDGFKHSSIPYWIKTLEIMSAKTSAFKADFSDDMAVFTEQNLQKYDAVCLNNTTQLKFNDAQKAALMNFVKGGKGMIGIHAATDNFYEWPEAAEMMGGQFKGHPWGGGGTWAIKLDQPNHPLMKMFEGKGFKVNDEIYRTAAPLYSRSKQLVLMSLDMSDEATKNAEGVTPEDADTGISWIKNWGQGRVFYCSLGHNHYLTWTPAVLQHYLAGIQFALGDYDVPTKPQAAPLDKSKLDELVKQAKSYEYGKSRLPFTQLQEMIVTRIGALAALAEIETAFLAALQDVSVPYDAKDMFCRQLGLFGTEKSVVVLSPMLADPKTSDIARYALERIPGDAVDQALLGLLAKTPDEKIKIGIISSLGARKTASAVKPLGALIQNPSSALSAAAILSLGRIGTTDAADQLLASVKTISQDNKILLLDALLTCAQKAESTKAAAIYQQLYGPDYPPAIRAGALRGLVQMQTAQPEKVIVPALQDKDMVVMTAAIALVREVKDTAAMEKILAGADSLPADQQVRMLGAIAAGGNTAGKNYAMKALKSESVEVRNAAVGALQVVGDAGCVEVLAQTAARASDKGEQDMARFTLDSLSDKNVNQTIISMLQKPAATDADKAVCRELIRTTGQRQIRAAMKDMLTLARSEDNRIRQEAIRALQLIADASDLPELVALLAEKPDNAVQGLVVSVIGKQSQVQGSAKVLTETYDKTQNKTAKVALLSAIGRIGDTQTVDFLRKQAVAPDAEIAQAAFRAMSDWPGSELTEDMKQVVVKSQDEKTKVIAFRSYLRMISKDSGRSSEQIVDELVNAMKLVDRSAEQKQVLSALSGYGSEKALNVAIAAMENPELKAEAEVAIVGICSKIGSGLTSTTAKAALQKIMETSSNNSLKEQAGKIYQELDKKAGYILEWEVSAPYSETQKTANDLYDIKFVPETDAGSVTWKPMPKSDNPDQFWLVNIGKEFSGNDRAAYIRTTLVSEAEIDAVFEIGSDDGVMIWLDGKLIHTNKDVRPVTPASDKVKVRLEKDANPVLVKVVQGSGEWGFCLRVVTQDGKPVNNMRAIVGSK
ncbi:MAG: ThuA domain-containing protein [Anaerohalosphaeraceae bacterium]